MVLHGQDTGSLGRKAKARIVTFHWWILPRGKYGRIPRVGCLSMGKIFHPWTESSHRQNAKFAQMAKEIRHFHSHIRDLPLYIIHPKTTRNKDQNFYIATNPFLLLPTKSRIPQRKRHQTDANQKPTTTPQPPKSAP